jgi:hypothetical protein
MGAGRGKTRRVKGTAVSPGQRTQFEINSQAWLDFVIAQEVDTMTLPAYYLGEVPWAAITMDMIVQVLGEFMQDMFAVGAIKAPDGRKVADYKFSLRGQGVDAVLFLTDVTTGEGIELDKGFLGTRVLGDTMKSVLDGHVPGIYHQALQDLYDR